MAKFTCPICLDKYSFKKIKYVCPECGMEAVPKMLECEPIKCKTPNEQGLATIRVCPTCHGDIPHIALKTPHLPISITGTSGSGKTNYIAMMLHELLNAPMRLAFGSATNETRDWQRTNERFLFGDIVPDFAMPGITIPLIWYIKNLVKKRLFKKGVLAYRFTIFDFIDKDCEMGKKILLRYICDSKYIILTIDVLSLKGARKHTATNCWDNAKEKDAFETIMDLIRFVRAANNLKPGKMLSFHFAIVLTKFDTMLQNKNFDFSSLVKKSTPSISNGRIDLAEINQVSKEICDWLQKIGESRIINAIAANCSMFKFFAVSNFSVALTEDGTAVQKIQSHRVLDPMLWLFKLKKFVD